MGTARTLFCCLVLAVASQAQDSARVAQETNPSGWPSEAPEAAGLLQVPAGTRIPLSLINAISTKNSAEGDRVYLETVYPILAGGKVVIPPGSYVMGTITEVKRPGRVKGRGELYIRFDSLTLPNGVTRQFRARVGGLDGSVEEELDREEGTIKSESDKSGDAQTVATGTSVGASVGAIAGSAAGDTRKGLGIGAAAGAAAGLMGVLLSRGPDVTLPRGTILEMVLDRPLTFTPEEVDFSGSTLRKPHLPSGTAPGATGQKESDRIRLPGRRVGGVWF